MNEIKETTIQVVESSNGKRIFLGEGFPYVYLTIREAEVVQLLSTCKYHEISSILNLSRRTVEYYTLNIKRKFQCETKRQLIWILKKSNILPQIAKVVDIQHLFKKDALM